MNIKRKEKDEKKFCFFENIFFKYISVFKKKKKKQKYMVKGNAIDDIEFKNKMIGNINMK